MLPTSNIRSSESREKKGEIEAKNSLGHSQVDHDNSHESNSKDMFEGINGSVHRNNVFFRRVFNNSDVKDQTSETVQGMLVSKREHERTKNSFGEQQDGKKIFVDTSRQQKLFHDILVLFIYLGCF